MGTGCRRSGRPPSAFLYAGNASGHHGIFFGPLLAQQVSAERAGAGACGTLKRPLQRTAGRSVGFCVSGAPGPVMIWPTNFAGIAVCEANFWNAPTRFSCGERFGIELDTGNELVLFSACFHRHSHPKKLQTFDHRGRVDRGARRTQLGDKCSNQQVIRLSIGFNRRVAKAPARAVRRICST